MISALVVLILIALFQLYRVNLIELFVMPGPLTRAHAAYEGQCPKCHSAFDKNKQDLICLDCHKDVASDITLHQGLHGRRAGEEDKACKACHTEHKGRAYDIVRLDKETFKHDRTDFALHGAHALSSVTCRSCHQPGRPYRAAPEDCYSCHAKNDHHHEELGKDCARCHNDTGWKNALFVHAKTNFPLNGKHVNVACNICHVNEKYTKTAVACVACHLINDVHNSPRDARCEQCHSTRGWKNISFDHDKGTKFALTGKHLQTACAACHAANVFTTTTPTNCLACHKLDDTHKAKNGTKCEQCHTTSGWKKVTFDHDRDTHFLLSGKHRAADCEACHRIASADMKIDKACLSCHQAQDVHKGQEGKDCQSCHNDAGWKVNVKFDHDRTRFQLKGPHIVLACNTCHLSAAFKDAKRACSSCHEKDDTHKGALGEDCAQCHTADSWKQWDFKHNIMTKFLLTEAHETLKCRACHNAPLEHGTRLPTDCASCHQKDDVHKSASARDCQRCHNAGKWQDVSKFDHDLTHFPLIGQHAVLACTECHHSAAYQDTQPDCGSCHARQDTHKSALGTDCGQCHNPNGWKLWQFDHDRQTKYKLEGPHAGIKCAACHNKPLAKGRHTSSDCFACHENDDVHKGQFGENCGLCHAVDTFKKYFIRDSK